MDALPRIDNARKNMESVVPLLSGLDNNKIIETIAGYSNISIEPFIA